VGVEVNERDEVSNQVARDARGFEGYEQDPYGTGKFRRERTFTSGRFSEVSGLGSPGDVNERDVLGKNVGMGFLKDDRC
jgi:hypothetical protein